MLYEVITQADTLCDHVDSAFYMPGGTNTIGTCNVLKGCTVNTSTGGAPSAMSLLNIFPNPAQDRTTVLLSGDAFPDSGPVYVEIMDLVGRIIV